MTLPGQYKRLLVFDNVRDLSVGHHASSSPYGRMKNARDAAAITAVAAQPQIAIDRDSVSRPMTLGLRTISIITAISGAREHPVDHRRPIERAHRIKSN